MKSHGADYISTGGHNQALFTGPVTQIPVTRSWYWEVDVTGVSISGITDTTFAQAGTAVFDTGNGITVAPQAFLDQIFGAVQGAFPIYHQSHTFIPPSAVLGEGGDILPQDGPDPHRLPLPNAIKAWAYPCALAPTITIFLNKNAFAFNPLDLNLGQIPSSGGGFIGEPGSPALTNALAGKEAFCLSSIVGRRPPLPEAVPRYFLGTNFLKNWYSIFSQEMPLSVKLAKAIHNDPGAASGSGGAAGGGGTSGGGGASGSGGAPGAGGTPGSGGTGGRATFQAGPSEASTDEGTVGQG